MEIEMDDDNHREITGESNADARVLIQEIIEDLNRKDKVFFCFCDF